MTTFLQLSARKQLLFATSKLKFRPGDRRGAPPFLVSSHSQCTHPRIDAQFVLHPTSFKPLQMATFDRFCCLENKVSTGGLPVGVHIPSPSLPPLLLPQTR